MGVQGLTTFVEGHRNLFKDVKFRDSRLVIDGCSLYFRLYFENGLDQQHGGDYDAFSHLLSAFFSALADCNIQPYVVLDGGMDPSDKKFSTLRQRLQSKIREAEVLCHGRHASVLPILTRAVFTQVLIQRGVPVVQCPAEADWEIACLAYQWNCPVLTNDSDFYIFDLPGGYLPLRFFQWTNLRGKAPRCYISARCYTAIGLCQWFGMRRELLPLCAVLTGNDYGSPRGAEKVLAWLDDAGLVQSAGRGKGNASSCRIEGLLLWLSSFSGLDEAVEEVSELMGETDRRGGGRGQGGNNAKHSSQLWAGMHEYYINPQSSLASWFSGGRAAPGGEASGFTQLPECLSRVAAQGLLAPLVLDALVMRRVLLIPQVENSKLASSHCSARAIRQGIYWIVLRRPGQDSQAHGRSGSGQQVKGAGGVQAQYVNISQGQRGGRGRGGCQVGAGRCRNSPVQQAVNTGVSSGQGAGAAASQAQSCAAPICVEEYDRLDLNLKKNQVEANPLKTPICLDTIGQAPVAVRLGVLLEVLGVNESVLAPVPLHLRLFVAVTGFWMREASPPPSLHQLQALLLGAVYGELSWNNQPGANHHQHAGPRATEHTVGMCLDRQRVRPGQRRGLDVGLAHSLSQWQACLWSALSLNQLLLLPLHEPHISQLFSGTLVHGLLRSLNGGHPAESFLPGGSRSAQLYRCLLDAVNSCSSKAHSSTQSAKRRRGNRRGGRGRGRGRGGRGGGGGGGERETDEMSNKFALLMSEEEFDDD
ncbi:protein asteroid homolog 1 [Myripristis murdjan]|uniref:XPG N-terminal domain-containing protein n=1 Tax=Myripristis murdjan TaxID=586833 RepID=A0A667YEK2_9TELE|nr:protein asteroid homolog 1-like [Myripristis murdjan]